MKYSIDGKTIVVPDVMPDKPAWRVLLNGEEVTDVTSLAAINEAMGIAFLYGGSMTGGAYNQGHLYNRGGAVIILRVKKDGEFFVAVLEQNRPLQSNEPVLEFPRGQSQADEEHLSTAIRELKEETGLDLDDLFDSYYWGCGNPDNALILGENVKFFTFEIREWLVDWDAMKIREDSFRPDVTSRLSEGIKGSKIVPLKGFRSSSMMTMSAVAFLRAHLD